MEIERRAVGKKRRQTRHIPNAKEKKRTATHVQLGERCRENEGE
jgi:hypothetical protein